MKRVFHFVIVAALAGKALVFAQGADVNKVLAQVREALGGEQKLSAITSLTITGTSTRVSAEGSGPAQDFEMALQLPDKFMKKEVFAVMNGTSLSRTSGFNGSGVIEVMDAPPGMMGGGGGTMMIRSVGGGGTSTMGMQQTPEQLADQRKATLMASRQEFARLTLGMFATSFKGYPLTFSYAGTAEAPDGKADVIDVKGEGDFAVKLFVDTKTHLPLMLSWMAKEPLVMRMGPGNTSFGSGGGGQFVTRGGGGGNINPEQLMKEMEDRRKEAEANRRTVEYRLYYGDYKTVDGIKLPSQLQVSVDGKPSTEQKLERIKLNPKIDPSKFETIK
jgi:hypothetical protein